MNTRVKEVLHAIVEQFKSGDIPEAVAFSMFPAADIPSAKWSIINRIVMWMAGTKDARGIRKSWWDSSPNRYSDTRTLMGNRLTMSRLNCRNCHLLRGLKNGAYR